MNFARDVVAARDPRDRALVELRRGGGRREWSFAEVDAASGALAGHLVARGIGRGDVVLTLIGNRPEWVLAMVACFRIGAAVLPCNEQLRAKDLRLRLAVTRPKVVLVDERNLAELEQAEPGCDVIVVPDDALFVGDAPPFVDLDPEDPCLLTFTSGTEGDPKAVVHVQRYLDGQRVQAEHWLDARPGDLVWCTAASGWSKSARNVFIAPWLRGASALLHDGRFDPDERLRLLADEDVNVLCMAPTEYRVIAKRTQIGSYPQLRGLVAAGEALNPEVLDVWRAATGLEIRDGFGQTETGQLTGTPLGQAARPGSMGRPLPGVRLWIDDGELVVDPATVPTFFAGYLSSDTARPAPVLPDPAQRGPASHVPALPDPAPRDRPWRTGDRVREEDGWFFFEGRTDDVISSAGYRIGPFEVESALVAHPSVAEAAVVSAPDEERGQIVRAVVVLRDGITGDEALVAELQTHVKETTAPYKYPRRVDFVDELPKTTSGKVQRALLRRDGA